MRRTVIIILGLAFLFLLSGCGGEAQVPPDETGVLRFDGLYCYIWDFDNDGLTNNYALRFYEDGTVIHASVEQKEKDGNYFPRESWFNRDSEHYVDLLGNYTLDGGAITLTTKDPKGSVYYQGTVEKDRLMLDSHSAINGHEVKGGRYVFFPFDQLPD